MKTYPIRFCFLLLFLLVIGVQQVLSQTPAPATGTYFQLPLADKTTVNAVCLPTLDGQAWLIYATLDGKIGLYLISPSTSPGPTPPIPPIPNPNPPTPVPPSPTPQKLTIAIVEDPRATTQAQKQIMVDKEWRALAIDRHTFIGLIPQDIKEKETAQPPASLLPFLVAAKTHSLPCLVMFDRNMSLVYAAELPNTAAEITAIIRKYGGN